MNKGLKLAALRLATLHPADQGWLLAQLTVEQQELLRPEVDRLRRHETELLQQALEQALAANRTGGQHEPDDAQADVKALLNQRNLPRKLADALHALKDSDDFGSRVRRSPVVAMETLAE